MNLADEEMPEFASRTVGVVVDVDADDLPVACGIRRVEAVQQA